MTISREDLAKRFNYHRPPSPAGAQLHEKIRGALQHTAEHVLSLAATGIQTGGGQRELATFVTKMEEAMFWANAALARNWPPATPPATPPAQAPAPGGGSTHPDDRGV